MAPHNLDFQSFPGRITRLRWNTELEWEFGGGGNIFLRVDLSPSPGSIWHEASIKIISFLWRKCMVRNHISGSGNVLKFTCSNEFFQTFPGDDVLKRNIYGRRGFYGEREDSVRWSVGEGMKGMEGGRVEVERGEDDREKDGGWKCGQPALKPQLSAFIASYFSQLRSTESDRKIRTSFPLNLKYYVCI